MRQTFAGKIAVVTGATSGIGRETARLLTAAGAVVVGTGRDQSRLEALAADVDLALTLDVTDPRAVDVVRASVLDRYGGVDLLVNNAGVGCFRGWEATDDSVLSAVMDVDFFGAVRVARAFLPSILERNGVLVQVASVAGRRGYARLTAYCAAKHALIGWSEALRVELRGSGAAVVVVCPPAVRTPFFENAGYTTFDEDHPGLLPMSAEAAARGILEAATLRTQMAILSPRAKALDALHRISPRGLAWVQRFK